ncbi:Transposase, IS4 family [Komagataeibacter xylinus E25]|nr:Transposase, IS4 family [Komagataeibacter xylinus E25]
MNIRPLKIAWESQGRTVTDNHRRNIGRNADHDQGIRPAGCPRGESQPCITILIIYGKFPSGTGCGAASAPARFFAARCQPDDAAHHMLNGHDLRQPPWPRRGCHRPARRFASVGKAGKTGLRPDHERPGEHDGRTANGVAGTPCRKAGKGRDVIWLIGRMRGRMNRQPYAMTDREGHPPGAFMTAGRRSSSRPYVPSC